jgi:excisionase family DNA binding protein
MATDYLTAAELGRRLRLSPETIHQMARDGRIPCIRLSAKVIRFDAEAVAAALTPSAVAKAGVQ